MRINQHLLSKLDDSIIRMDESVYSQFSKEVHFIDKAIESLDNINEKANGQSVRIQVKEMHQSPYVTFDRPDYVRSTNPEFADLFFLVNFFENKSIIERRASFSQSKFTDGSLDDSADRNWEIKMHQHYFLHNLEEFTFTWKSATEEFTIQPVNDTFTTYSFASDFLWPFFQSTNAMRRYMYELNKDPTDFTLPRKYPFGTRRFHAVVKQLVRGQYGEPFKRGDEVYDLIEYMFRHAKKQTFTKSDTENRVIDHAGHPIPDGGEDRDMTSSRNHDNREENDDRLVIFEIDVGLDTEAFGNPEEEWYMYDEFGDDLRYSP